MSPAFVNTFKVPNSEFFSAELMKEMNILNNEIEKYYKYLNIWNNIDYYNEQRLTRFKYTKSQLEYYIMIYHDNINFQIREIKDEYNIKFNETAIKKLLYPENGYLKDEY
jgi:hypothetical protein